MAERFLIREPLHVDPALVGSPLASPARRFGALAIDLIVLLVPTVTVIIGAAVLALRADDPAALRAFRTILWPPPNQPERHAAMRRATGDLLPRLVKVEARGLPAAAIAAVEEGDVAKAAELVADYDFLFALKLGEEAPAEPLQPKTIQVPVERFIPSSVRAVALLGVPALYFVVFTRGRRGATLGKRVFGIRVARLDGERLSWLEALERFVGYVHIPATLFLGVADLWRDPNRRLAHDRTVHTAVFRVRPAARAARRDPRDAAAPQDRSSAGPRDDSADPSTQLT